MKKKTLFCTLGPSSLNKKFLKFASKKKIDLLRLNLSHIELKDLSKIIKFIKENTSCNICIDTEGAQIRTKAKVRKKFKVNQKGFIHNKNDGIFNLYPQTVFANLRKEDTLDIGFEGLKVKILKCKKNIIEFKTLSEGYLENNKGVHLVNRNINLNFLSTKDIKAIEIAKKMNIKNFALSFTNSHKDILRFNNLLKNENKIFKIETKNAIKDFKNMLKFGNKFLIDRGDLSKDISIEKIPVAQRYIVSEASKKENKEIYIATNFLESMIKNSSPTRSEANDIYNSLEMGASGIVLAAETAIGVNPEKCVNFIKSLYAIHKKNNKKELLISSII